MRSIRMAEKEASKRGLPYPKLMRDTDTGDVVLACEEVIAAKAAAITFRGVMIYKCSGLIKVGSYDEFQLEHYIDYRGSIELSNDEVK